MTDWSRHDTAICCRPCCWPAPTASPRIGAPAVPLAAFVYEDQFSHPRLAPDGKHIAITVRIPDGDRHVPVVMVYSVPEHAGDGAIRMPAFEVPLDYRWVSTYPAGDHARAVELGSREKPVSTGEVLAADLDGSKQEYLYGYRMRKFSARGDRYGTTKATATSRTSRARNGRTCS
jgi:hypothetical protein